MITLSKKAVFSFLFYSRIHSVFKLFNGRNKLTILGFHGLYEGEISPVMNNAGLFIEKSKFERLLVELKSNYTIISLADAFKFFSEGESLPKNALVITFDDGYKSNYLLAYPVLKRLNLPATVFLTAGLIAKNDLLWFNKLRCAVFFTDKKRLFFEGNVFDISDDFKKMYVLGKLRELCQNNSNAVREKLVSAVLSNLCFSSTFKEFDLLSWSDVKKMNRLISFGSHTLSHPYLSKVSSVQLRKEIFDSKKLIEKNNGGNCLFFAYPSGTSKDFTGNVAIVLKRAGYVCALTTIEGFNKQGDNLYNLKRFCVDGRDSVQASIVKISGALFWRLRN